jgi:putative heme-binding domain-containing protein
MPSYEWMTGAAEIRQIAAYVASLGQNAVEPIPGDARRGRELYRTKGNCANCHMLNGSGGRLGPDLSAVGRRRNAAYLRRSLVDPAADIPGSSFLEGGLGVTTDSFLLLTAVTADGRKIRGVRLNEDPFSIQIRDLSDQIHSFWKRDLVEVRREKGVTPMPGYGSIFSPGELDDMVGYLVSLRGEP